MSSRKTAQLAAGNSHRKLTQRVLFPDDADHPENMEGVEHTPPVGTTSGAAKRPRSPGAEGELTREAGERTRRRKSTQPLKSVLDPSVHQRFNSFGDENQALLRNIFASEDARRALVASHFTSHVDAPFFDQSDFKMILNDMEIGPTASPGLPRQVWARIRAAMCSGFSKDTKPRRFSKSFLIELRGSLQAYREDARRFLAGGEWNTAQPYPPPRPLMRGDVVAALSHSNALPASGVVVEEASRERDVLFWKIAFDDQELGSKIIRDDCIMLSKVHSMDDDENEENIMPGPNTTVEIDLSKVAIVLWLLDLKEHLVNEIRHSNAMASREGREDRSLGSYSKDIRGILENLQAIDEKLAPLMEHGLAEEVFAEAQDAPVEVVEPAVKSKASNRRSARNKGGRRDKNKSDGGGRSAPSRAELTNGDVNTLARDVTKTMFASKMEGDSSSSRTVECVAGCLNLLLRSEIIKARENAGIVLLDTTLKSGLEMLPTVHRSNLPLIQRIKEIALEIDRKNMAP